MKIYNSNVYIYDMSICLHVSKIVHTHVCEVIFQKKEYNFLKKLSTCIIFKFAYNTTHKFVFSDYYSDGLFVFLS